MSIVWNNFIRGALMFRAAICQGLFCQKVLTENSSNFPFVKVSQYAVAMPTLCPLLLLPIMHQIMPA